MDVISIPTSLHVESNRANAHHARIVIEPCYPGYGLTLGNALRRVMLSSVEGAAVDAVKIRGATHEFSSIPHVKEDVVEIILNLKQLRVQVHTDARVELKLHVTSKQKVTAADINTTSDVTVTNPELYLFSTTASDVNVEMIIWVKRGRGYEPVEEKDKREFELGVIAVDSLFSPVQSVALATELVRVGQRTDYQRIILDVVTDGTISPEAVLRDAARALVTQFQAVVDQASTASESEFPVETDHVKDSSEKPKKRASKKKTE